MVSLLGVVLVLVVVVSLVVVATYTHAIITQYGSTVCIGIAMVYPH